MRSSWSPVTLASNVDDTGPWVSRRPHTAYAWVNLRIFALTHAVHAAGTRVHQSGATATGTRRAAEQKPCSGRRPCCVSTPGRRPAHGEKPQPHSPSHRWPGRDLAPRRPHRRNRPNRQFRARCQHHRARPRRRHADHQLSARRALLPGCRPRTRHAACHPRRLARTGYRRPGGGQRAVDGTNAQLPHADRLKHPGYHSHRCSPTEVATPSPNPVRLDSSSRSNGWHSRRGANPDEMAPRPVPRCGVLRVASLNA